MFCNGVYSAGTVKVLNYRPAACVPYRTSWRAARWPAGRRLDNLGLIYVEKGANDILLLPIYVGRWLRRQDETIEDRTEKNPRKK